MRGKDKEPVIEVSLFFPLLTRKEERGAIDKLDATRTAEGNESRHFPLLQRPGPGVLAAIGAAGTGNLPAENARNMLKDFTKGTEWL
jgi:hypothetical protein